MANSLIFERVTSAETRHKGAQRQPFTFVRPASEEQPSMSCAWYKVPPGERLSLHKHTNKSEIWFIVSGSGVATIGEETVDVEPGTAILTPPNIPHALENNGTEPLVLVDVAHPPSQRDPETGQIHGTIELEE